MFFQGRKMSLAPIKSLVSMFPGLDSKTVSDCISPFFLKSDVTHSPVISAKAGIRNQLKEFGYPFSRVYRKERVRLISIQC